MPPPQTIKLVAICAVLSGFLAACSNIDRSGASQRADTNAREFSEADKVAARALSIGQATTQSTTAEPGAQAGMCSDAIAKMLEQLRVAGGLDETQLAALENARLHYAREAQSASVEGATYPPSEKDEDADPEQTDAEAGRIAIACLRRLL